jgi:8-oxo-dGTP pyrophosphatase MutT (NUDIX family)
VAAAGHIPSGTSPDQAAHLELQEELGFDTPLTFVEKKLVHKSNETHFTYWYLGRYTNQPITLEPAEVQQTMLATRAQIHQLIDQHQLSPSSATMIPKHWPSTVTRSLNHEIK